MASCRLDWIQLLRELRTGTLSDEMTWNLLHHLAESCPSCLDQAMTMRSERANLSATAAVQGTAASVAELQAVLDGVQTAAQREARTLLALSPAERTQRIERAHKRFKSPLLVDILVAESRSRIQSDLGEALALAECASLVAFRLDDSQFGEAWSLTAISRASAWKGNVLRVHGDLKEAESLLEFGFELFKGRGTGDPLVEAELLSLLASLRKDQRRLEEAAALLDSAGEVYGRLQDTTAAAKIGVQRSTVLYNLGRPEDALKVTQQVLKSLDSTADTALLLGVLHNRALCLVELECWSECERLIAATEELYQQHRKEFSPLRRQWLVARVALGRKQFSEAETALNSVREQFVARSMGYDAALIGLDLSLLYLEQDRTTELKELAAEIVQIFHAQEIERETIAALLLFEEAAKREEVTRSIVQEMVRCVRAGNLGQKWRSPS